MRRGFNFEANLPHQTEAVESLLTVFKDTRINRDVVEYQNNIVEFNDMNLKINIKDIQNLNAIDGNYISNNKIFDIHMETGTGKTYTYTKSIFELNKSLGVFKFIIVVPSLAIKAGTVNFFKSNSTKEHFRGLYDKQIKLHVVESRENKSKKKTIPQSISEFVRNTNMSQNIQVLVINSHMINSKTMVNKFDSNLLDKYNVPLDGLINTNPITIIDEPHKFPETGKTFENVLKFNSQFIIRYGATFKDKENKFTYENLLYSLNAIKSFNQDLVKGINAHVLTFKDGINCDIKFISSDGNEAVFELNDNSNKKRYKIGKGEKLDIIHNQISNLGIETLNKTKIVLDNGLEMIKGDKINPYSYSTTTQEHMIRETLKKHFELEKELLTRDLKIKPITLFFIDKVNSYRNDDMSNGKIAILVEKIIEEEINKILQNETSDFYKDYLNKSLNNLSDTHGGYFSKDNSSKDEKIEKEINEIIHDKEALLDLDNTRRFIFSKWTLKEGWDNPNVFQICKLRSSGSETSKLQEVGRGLRIPVNQYMERVKDEQFELNYFVDFTEKDFVDKLTNEINSDTIFKINDEVLEESLIEKIVNDYKLEDDNELLGILVTNNIIEFNKDFKEKGLEKLKELYPISFEELKSGKITGSNSSNKEQITIRKENYSKLKNLWEQINKKVILEYDFKNEEEVEKLFYNCLKKENLYESKLVLTTHNLNKKTGEMVLRESVNTNESSLSVLKYSEFLESLSNQVNINISTVNKVFIKLLKNNILDINNYLNYETIRLIKSMFKNHLIENVHGEFQIKYNEINSKIHPTKFTDPSGNVLDKIDASDVGKEISEETVVDNYLFEELYFDSELEKKNIIEEIKEVVVFTKIPKKSIKIPIVGGDTYSPDFAYVIQFENGKKELNFIVETKNKEEKDLSPDEKNRIKSAEKLFKSEFFDVKFKKQMKNQKIVDLIKEIKNN